MSSRLLREAAARWGFPPPAGLLAFLEATDEDAVLRRWMSRLGMATVELRDLSIDWNADPCLLAFAGLGNGDEYALYLYPPALARAEPPIILYLHEENACEYLSPTFDSFLAGYLARGKDQHPEMAALASARLGLAPRRESAGRRPSFLIDGRASPPPWAEVEALEAGGSLLRAERGYLAQYLAGGEACRAAHDALARVYESLGWSAALRALRRASEHV